jgi:hypothetical protein
MEINQTTFKSIKMSNTVNDQSNIKSEPTYFGQACLLFIFNLLNRVIETVNSSDSKFDYYRVPFNKYHEVFSVKFGTDNDAHVKKYHVHKLIYGPTKVVKCKEEFQLRTDEEDFWAKQWGFEYSPFRMAQKMLKDHGLYLVDHTFGGETPFFYLYKYLPARGVIDKKPWHDYCNVPALCSKDFSSKKLSPEETIAAATNALAKFSAMCVKENLTTDNFFYSFEEDTLSKKKVFAKKKPVVEATPITPSNSSINDQDDHLHDDDNENGSTTSTAKKTYAQVIAANNP